MITLETRFRTLQFTKTEQSLATGAYTRAALQPHFAKAMGSKPPFTARSSISLHESVLERMISKYSEQVIYQPLSEIRFWFEYSRGLFVDRGYPPLFYSKKSGAPLSPNKSAICAVGEGVAGFVAQQIYRCRRLARPNHDYPDIVMEGGNRTYLIEAKATIDTSDCGLITTMAEELPRFTAYTSTCTQMDVRPVMSLLVGTLLIDAGHYRTFVSEIEML